MQNLNRYLKKNNIDFETQMQVKKYMNFLWKIEERQTTEKESEIFNKLSSHLKEEILLQTYGKILFQIPLFNKNFSKHFLTRVLSLMKPVYYDPNSIIYQVKNYCYIEIIKKVEKSKEILTKLDFL